MPPFSFPGSTQNVIACVWDFDKTLIPGYMQEPIFRRFKVDENSFWDEVNGLPGFHRRHGLELVAQDSLYLNHILTYVRHGLFPGLNNRLLRELGDEIVFFEGLPQFFELVSESVRTNPRYEHHELRVEHYVVSTGLRQMILGSKIAPYLDGVWACEFVERVPPPGYLMREAEPADGAAEPGGMFEGTVELRDVGYVIDNTTKTRAIFEINKGTNVAPEIDVNAKVPQADRRVPFQNMIYVADGPSDVPVFSVVRQFGGKTFAVYRPGSKASFVQVNELQRQGRIDSFGEACYRPGLPDLDVDPARGRGDRRPDRRQPRARARESRSGGRLATSMTEAAAEGAAGPEARQRRFGLPRPSLGVVLRRRWSSSCTWSARSCRPS